MIDQLFHLPTWTNPHRQRFIPFVVLHICQCNSSCKISKLKLENLTMICFVLGIRKRNNNSSRNPDNNELDREDDKQLLHT